jgi:hypothetical protein
MDKSTNFDESGNLADRLKRFMEDESTTISVIATVASIAEAKGWTDQAVILEVAAQSLRNHRAIARREKLTMADLSAVEVAKLKPKTITGYND